MTDLRPARGAVLECDLPIGQPGLVVHNELLLTGWAAAAPGTSGVIVEIGDRLFNASYGLDTPALAESLPDVPGADRAGFRLRLDTSSWTPGPRHLVLSAYDVEGGRAIVEGEVDVRPFKEASPAVEADVAALADGSAALWLDEPRIVDGVAQVDGPLRISGWAHLPAGVDAVVVTIDGRVQHEAVRPVVRPDLLDHGAAVAADAGFALRLHAADCTPGRHSLSVVALGRDGEAIGVQSELICRPASPPSEDERAAATAVDWIDDGDRRTPRERAHETRQRYDSDVHAGLALEAEHQLRYRWAADLGAGKAVLDAGCGKGWGAALLARAGASSVVGIDSSEQALRDAARSTDGLAVELQCGDLEALPFEDASFDLVTCFDGMVEVADPDAAVAQLRRVLRPDGVLLIAAPRDGAPWERVLRERFANVSVHRQPTCLASALVGDGLAGGDDVEVRLRMPADLEVADADAVIVAGDGELPEAVPTVALASPQAVRRLHATALMWEDRALVTEADAAVSRTEARLAKAHQEGALHALQTTEAKLRDARLAQAELADTRRERDTTKAELAAARDDADAAQRELARLEARLREQEQELRDRSALLEQRSAQLESQQRSLSWRLTRPLRFAKRVWLRRRIRG